jgi:predicted nucleotidyltransferase
VTNHSGTGILQSEEEAVDLSHPINSIIPSVHGAVLDVLAHTDVPLSGRQTAELTAGRAKQPRVNQVLRELTETGIVSCERHASVHLYRLNRDHVAAEAIMLLINLREHLIQRMREAVKGWSVAPIAVWMFGSAARGEGGSHSDIDVLVVRPDSIETDDDTWLHQLSDLSAAATAWSGNDCQIVEFSRSELAELVAAGKRLVDELRADALTVFGFSPLRLLRRVKAA